MERKYTIAGAPEVRVAIRVRGMSDELRYFDEHATTTRLTRDFIVIRLCNRVDLDCELHILNMRTRVGGTYRVAWINTHTDDGFYPVGLELLDPEGEIWGQESMSDEVETGVESPIVPLECVRCSQQVSIAMPEVETVCLGEGFTIARPCETCKATTSWAYRVEKSPAPEPPTPNETTLPSEETAEATAETLAAALDFAEANNDRRRNGRAPICLAMKIMRNKYGLKVSDICETINVSRTGVYFATEQGYEVGEALEVILPYHPYGVAISIPARVVRQDLPTGPSQKRVAIHLTSETPM